MANETPARLASDLDALVDVDWRLTDTTRPLSVAEQIAERISRDILTGVYSPGERIIEQNIADSFQVSRGPVRDAIRILEREGVVEVLPRRGAQVTLLSVKEVDDIFAIRGALIALGIKLATPLLSAEDLVQVRDWIQQLADASASDGTTEDYVPISYNISLFLTRRCDNERLFDMVRSMSRQTLRYAHLGLASPERRAHSARLWSELAEALDARDGGLAGRLAQQLIEQSGKAARARLLAAESA